MRDKCARTIQMCSVAYTSNITDDELAMCGMGLQQVDFLFSRPCHVFSLCPGFNGAGLGDFCFRKVWPPSGAQQHQGSELCKMIGRGPV